MCDQTPPSPKKETFLAQWQQKARLLKRDTYAVYLACRDSRVSWGVKVAAAFVVGYAFSPIDLIPDFIPVLGYLDDLILVPLGIALVLQAIPAEVMEDCRRRAEDELQGGRKKPRNWIAAGIIVLLWALVLLVIGLALWRRWNGKNFRWMAPPLVSWKW